ncbi:MAG: precorrin-6y C5,15-methyltransferase (decarboxylating) subunit CbiE [Planctomycetota bacterium]|jgi:precorrin-6Y C5,15-methyltransferase (decarboxylating)|nr:precorrin-6y C5,15-methyltransferase (decarboxylating) subunit CbiE [Planctomycetota bacterium]
MRISLVGIGMGGSEGMTLEARKALEEADVVLGAERLLNTLKTLDVPCGVPAKKIAEALPENIARLVRGHPEWNRIAVALSGDIGFYSGARRLLDLLEGHDIHLFCGISSPQYFAARLRRPWQDFHLVSAHGTVCDILAETLNHPAVFFLTGGAIGAADIVNELCAAGLDDALVTVGENLAAANENIVAAKAGELTGRAFAPLAVALVENRRTFARAARSGGIEDSCFIRGKAPMTKREVRAVALSLLAPEENAVLYDIGAGTGSVAVEMALLARRGRVFAVEHDDEACDLAGRNREAFGAFNMTLVRETAPDALASLPAPDAAFIGGSAGRMKEIVAALLRKNPAVRIVASAVTVETLSRAIDSMRECGMSGIDATQIAVTRTVERGASRMFDALNPVFLISGGGRHG